MPYRSSLAEKIWTADDHAGICLLHDLAGASPLATDELSKCTFYRNVQHSNEVDRPDTCKLMQAEIQAAIESAVAQTQGSLNQLLAQAAANEVQPLTEDGQFSDENSPLPGGKQSGPPAFNRSPKKGLADAPEGLLSPSKTPQQPLTENQLLVFNAAHDGGIAASEYASASIVLLVCLAKA